MSGKAKIRSGIIFIFVIMLVSGGRVSTVVKAEVLYWAVNQGDWGHASNWDRHVEPTSDDRVYVCNSGTVKITQNGEAAEEVLLGWNATGYVSMSSGSLTLEKDIYIAGLGGTATFTQKGGTFLVKHDMWITYGEGDDNGYFKQSGGVTTVQGRLFFGLDAGDGVCELLGGTLNVYGNIHNCYDAQGDNKLIIDGGTLNASGYIHIDNFWVGNKGTGSYVHDAGREVRVSKNLTLGVNSGSKGTYKLSDGTLTVSENIVGGAGTSTFIIDGGTLNLSGEINVDNFYVGYDRSVDYEQVNDVTVNNNLYIGNNTGSQSSYTVSSGVLNVGGKVTKGSGVANLYIEGGTVHVPSVDVTSLTLGDGEETNGFYALNAGGTMKVSGDVCVANRGTGRIYQTGGTSTINGELLIAGMQDSYGRYDLSDGKLNVKNKEVVGKASEAVFLQIGGTNTTKQIIIGEQASSWGKYYIDDPSAKISVSDVEVVGRYGEGLFKHSSGTNDTVKLYLGEQSGSNGRYELKNGRLTASNYEVVGNYGAGTFVQDGGTNQPNKLYLGNFSGGNGVYELTKGTLTANYEYIGMRDEGTFTQSGGTHTVNNDLYLGKNSGSHGEYNLNGGQLIVHGNIKADAGSGIFSIEGGVLNVDGNITLDEWRIGYNSTGEYTQTEGVNSVTTLRIGKFAGSDGRYNLSGGNLNSGLVEIGPSGIGKFINTGGTHSMNNNLYVGTYGSGSGTYELSGAGSLSAPNEFLGNEGFATFNQYGGTNDISGTLYFGFWGAGDATYNLNAGSLSANDEIVGRYGSGTFEQIGGVNNVGDELILGKEAGSAGSYSISAGKLDVKNFYIGYNGSGVFDVADASADIAVSGLLSLGANSTFNAVADTVIHMTGANFENKNIDAADLSELSNVELIFEGGVDDIDLFEVAGEDLGATMAGLESNFALGTLTLGGNDIGQLQLIDSFDNQPDWIGDEAVYVYNLNINSGAYLDLNGLHLYYVNGSIDSGANIVGGMPIQIPEPSALLILLGFVVVNRRFLF